MSDPTPSSSPVNSEASSKASQIQELELAPCIAQELSLPLAAVKTVLKLFSEGSTVPFIARYRKEATGNLDEVALRGIAEKQSYFKELEDRRATILRSIEAQKRLSPELKTKILACAQKTQLEDLYLPYKSKRRTKAQIAREAGLEPLAQRILEQQSPADPQGEAAAYIRAEDPEHPGTAIADADAALAGAREIIAEDILQDPEWRERLRARFRRDGAIQTERAAGQDESARSKYEDYFEYQEPAKSIPSHRYLAIRRGEHEGELRTQLKVEVEPLIERCKQEKGYNADSPYAQHLEKAIQHAIKRRLYLSVETDIRVELKKRADEEAITVFADNLEGLLLSAPLGAKSVLGIDPGLRTGCKCAMVDATGKFLDHLTIYPLRGRGDEAKAQKDLLAFIQKHRPEAVAIGNGTGGRETEKLVRQWAKEKELQLCVVSISESGASIYSASDLAREEFPDLDLTIRGAISLARRLQDPLAELVKVEPKSIGVGQYQHDVSQTLLQKRLGQVVESCVNRVGVEVNTASAPLLSYVAGIGPSLAKKIVLHREGHGMFHSRQSIQDVSGFGAKAFEQAGGFLRVAQSENPLDHSAVHPERYELVQNIARDLQLPVEQLVGKTEAVESIDIKRYQNEEVGAQTLQDIVAELKKPGRDPRRAFEAVSFRDDVNEIGDLQEDMRLDGVVTNVTKFGAFVDIGVHQDGLVHISQLADRFVKDPSEVVKVGDRIKVRVMSVDMERKRIALSARTKTEAQAPGGAKRPTHGAESGAKGHASRGRNAKAGSRSPATNKRSSSRRTERDQGFSNNPFAKLRK